MEGLRSITDDLVRSSTKGVEIRDADGQRIVVFTDIVGYVSDYLETGHALDVTGQNGMAPCHLCSFLRYKGHPSTATRYAYTTVINSSDASYARTMERTTSIRASNITDDELVRVGLNPRNQAAKKNSPLVEYATKLQAALESAEIPVTVDGAPVVSPAFDPYISVFVSPDHVLFGVSVNALNFAFSILPSGIRRSQLDTLVSTSLFVNGLGKQDEIYNKKTAAVHAASISTRFASLLVFPECFEEVIKDCRRCQELRYTNQSPYEPFIRLLTKLRDLVSTTYWYPVIGVDSGESIKSFNENNGKTHLAKLESMCEAYVCTLNEICKAFPIARSELDKPNVHRVMELYKHSIPAMGHVRHFAELIFEAAHQPLKRAMLRSNFRDSHLQSSRTCMADDWIRRLKSVVTDLPEGDGDPDSVSSSDEYKTTQLAQLLWGRDLGLLDEVLSDKDLMGQLADIHRNDLIKTLLCANPSKLNNTTRSAKWVPSTPILVREMNPRLSNALKHVKSLVENFIAEEVRETKLYHRVSKVQCVVTRERLHTSNPKPHDIVRTGNLLQAWVPDAHVPVMYPSEEDDIADASLHYFVVEAIVKLNLTNSQHSEKNMPTSCFVLVRECEQVGDKLIRLMNNPEPRLLLLTPSVKRVCIVHACSNDMNLKCFSTAGGLSGCRMVASLLSGHLFYYYDRAAGYPPRMA